MFTNMLPVMIISNTTNMIIERNLKLEETVLTVNLSLLPPPFAWVEHLCYYLLSGEVFQNKCL